MGTISSQFRLIDYICKQLATRVFGSIAGRQAVETDWQAAETGRQTAETGRQRRLAGRRQRLG